MIYRPYILCFGEILWDILPDGNVLGGAPLNVGFHAHQLGATVNIISAVGNDQLGRDAIQAITNRGLSNRLIQIKDDYPTGVAKVDLDQSGAAVYRFGIDAAWDHISKKDEHFDFVRKSDVFIYGSLACRSQKTRVSLFELLEHAPFCVFDVNLRSPHYTTTNIEMLLHKADLVKMNLEELHIISSWNNVEGNQKDKMQVISHTYNIGTVIVTAGSTGAHILSANEFFFQPSFEVHVKDTVGSGDAFLAALIVKILKGDMMKDALEFASATGAYVTSQEGGTPHMNEKSINEFLLEKLTV
ncbi:MAG: carbohydrate kinase [Saprospiraceae bacterium]|nr:carbohydrate kinase [Saprospiraceae bacterium]